MSAALAAGYAGVMRVLTNTNAAGKDTNMASESKTTCTNCGHELRTDPDCCDDPGEQMAEYVHTNRCNTHRVHSCPDCLPTCVCGHGSWVHDTYGDGPPDACGEPTITLECSRCACKGMTVADGHAIGRDSTNQ